MADDVDAAAERIEAFTASALAAMARPAVTRPDDGLCRTCRLPIEDGRESNICMDCAEEAEAEKARLARTGRR